MIKLLLQPISWFIYHQGNRYLIRELHTPDLHHSIYILYRIDRCFLLRYNRFVDKTSLLATDDKKKNDWLFKYQNITLKN